MWHDPERHPDAACARLLDTVLLQPAGLLEEFAPQGWECSPLRHVFHPTPEQRASERERFRRNLAALRDERAPDGDALHDEPDDAGAGSDDGPDPAPTPLEPEREVVELLGAALWDVFSDNHTVVDVRGTAYDLGSFRASAGFIAEAINQRYPGIGRRYDYLDFYMGSLGLAERADLRPVYRWIFGRLKDAGCRWIYSFPRLYVVDLGGAQTSGDPLTYDPGEAVRVELEEAERTERVRSLAEDLDRAHGEDVHAARSAPLPAAVAAYRDVFGVLPQGWPHPEM